MLNPVVAGLLAFVLLVVSAVLVSELRRITRVWPGFDPEQIVGRCIDMFHKNPAHQRQMLSDPSRLPIRTEITIGDLKIALLVNG